MLLPEMRDDYANRLIRLGLAVQVIGTELDAETLPDEQLMKTLTEILDKIDKLAASVSRAAKNGA